MTRQNEQAALFHSLHVKGNPIVLYNIWDAGSAKAVEKAGAKALATGSAPVAMAYGFADGENMPLQLALENIRRIVNAVDIPVSMDLEGGYGVDATVVAETTNQALEAGAVGFNFEDQIVGTNELHPVDIQAERIAAMRSACETAGINAFINARTDIFLKAKPDTHNQTMLDEAIERAKAYQQAGASGFFAPGLADEAFIGKLCEASSLPINIIALPYVPAKARLIELGVSRISYGPVGYKNLMGTLTGSAKAALD